MNESLAFDLKGRVKNLREILDSGELQKLDQSATQLSKDLEALGEVFPSQASEEVALRAALGKAEGAAKSLAILEFEAGIIDIKEYTKRTTGYRSSKEERKEKEKNHLKFFSKSQGFDSKKFLLELKELPPSDAISMIYKVVEKLRWLDPASCNPDPDANYSTAFSDLNSLFNEIEVNNFDVSVLLGFIEGTEEFRDLLISPREALYRRIKNRMRKDVNLCESLSDLGIS